MRRVGLIIAAAAVGASASSGSAAIFPSWSQVAITATSDGVTPPPGLQNYQSYDLNVTLTPGDDFTSFRLLFNPEGSIFNHTLGGGAPNFGPPNSALFPTFPALQFDSYLRGPAGGVTVLGSTDGINDLPPPGIFDSDRIAVTARDLTTNSQGGTFQLLRVTFGPGPIPIQSAGTHQGRVFSLENPQGFEIPNIAANPAEPSVLSLLAATALLAIRPRRPAEPWPSHARRAAA